MHFDNRDDFIYYVRKIHLKEIRAYFLKWHVHRDDVDDCSQDTLKELWEKWEKYKVNREGQGVMALVYRFAFYILLRYGRKRYKQLRLNNRLINESSVPLGTRNGDPITHDMAPPTFTDRSIAEFRINYGLGERFDQFFEVVFKHCEGMTYDKIAQSMGIPANRLNKRQKRARDEIREIIQQVDCQNSPLGR